MNVVTRSLMVAGLFVYAAIHFLQTAQSPASAPAWLPWAFVATAVAAVVVGVGLVVRRPGGNQLWKDAAAFLAAGSLFALVLSGTTGFLGVDEMDISAGVFGVVAAEFIILVSWLADRSLGPEFNEVDG